VHAGLAEDGLYVLEQYHVKRNSSDPGTTKQVPTQQKQPWHHPRMNGYSSVEFEQKVVSQKLFKWSSFYGAVLKINGGHI